MAPDEVGDAVPSSSANPGVTPRRLVYLGTPALAVPPLVALVDAGFEMALVVSGPDKRRGRGGKLMPSPVKAAALELGLAVTDDLGAVLDVGADLGVVVAYGRIIPTSVLDRLAMVNLHFSLLPRWRGAAPVERAILAGDEQTGVCVMQVAPELDSGGVYACSKVDIGADETLDELRGRLVELGSTLLVESLDGGLGEPVAQGGEVTYAHKIRPEELHIDWSGSAVEISRTVRLGGAWTTFRGRRLKVWRIALVDAREGLGAGEMDVSPEGVVVGTGDGAARLVEVQPEGKGRMAAAAWGNGVRPGAGESFES